MSAPVRIAVVAATDAHAAELASFFQAAWGATGNAEDVIAARRAVAAVNPVDPGIHPPTFVVTQGPRIIGYCTSIPVNHWDGETVRGGYWAKGLMVLPEFRNGPVGFLVLKELTRALSLGTAVTVASGSKRLFGALGYRDHGAIPNFLLPLRLRRIAHRIDPQLLNRPGVPAWGPKVVGLAQRCGAAFLAGAIGGAALRLGRMTRGRTALTLQPMSTIDQEELSQLWHRCAKHIGAGPVRDGAALRRRYTGPDAGGDYHFGAVRDDGVLVGAAILRAPRAEGDPRLAGLRVASLSDLLFEPDRPDVGVGVLSVAARMAASLDTDAILCSASHRAVVAAVRSQFYVPLGGNIHFFLRDQTAARPWPLALDEWWLTRGDGFSDESF